MATLALPEGEVYFEEHGSGASLLLLHAGVADSGMWDAQIEAFAGRFRTVRCDLRGYGRSPLPDAPFAYHEDVKALVEGLALAPVWLVAASFGARVAVDFALSFPEMVAGMVLLSPVVGGFEPDDEVRAFGEQEDELLAAGRLEAATELNLKMWVDGPQRAPDQVNPVLRQRVGEMQLRAFSQPEPANVACEWPTPPAIKRLGEIVSPVLIISGALDVDAFLRLARSLETGIPGAKLALIPETAHLANMERPLLFNKMVVEFIRAHT